MTDHILRAILQHQEQGRKLIEDMVKEFRELTRDVAAMEVRVSGLERVARESVRDSKECRQSMQERFSVVDAEQRKIIEREVDLRQGMRHESMVEIRRLEERLGALERRAAEMGGRYGAYVSITIIFLAEAVRWIFKLLATR